MSPAPASFLPWLGVFETVRVAAGRPLFLEEHWASFLASARALGLEVQADFRAATLPTGSGRWRWIATPEEVCELFTPEAEDTRPAYHLHLAAQRVGSENWDARHKTLSHLTHWQARQAAQAAGADEALLLNERGELASGAMSNLFWVSGGLLHTPPVEAGCRNGVIRQWVMGKKKTAALSTPPHALETADEIFVTNSMIGIKPVVQFGARALPVGLVTVDLVTRYRTAIS